MFAMLFQTQIFLLAGIVALTLSIEKMFRNNFCGIAVLSPAINLMEVALWSALQLSVKTNNNGMAALKTSTAESNRSGNTRYFLASLSLKMVMDFPS
jgi:hypothetical protein